MKQNVDLARKLRKDATDAENHLWLYLRRKQMGGLKFKRQEPIGNFIADFVCYEKKLVIELDGGHPMVLNVKDNSRDEWLNSQGFKVIRFWNSAVFQNTIGVLESIRQSCLDHPPLNPLPSREGKVKNLLHLPSMIPGFASLLKFGTICALLHSSCHASSLGTSAAPHLRLRTSARAESLAGALTAGSDDLSGAPINPANLSRLRTQEMLLTQGILFEDAKYSYVGYALPFRWGAPMVEYMNLSYGDFDEIDRSGSKVGTLSPKDAYLGLGWSTNPRFALGKRLHLGGIVRYLSSDLGGTKADALSFNAGALYQLPFEGLSAGLAVNHLGGELRYANDGYPQPRTIRLGLGYATPEFLSFSSRARFSLDGVAPREGNATFAAGLEFTLLNYVSFQAGYAGEEKIENRLRFGMGLGLEALHFQYAAAPSGDLGTVHTLSVRMRFGSGLWSLSSLLSGEYGIRQDIENARLWRDKSEFQRASFYANRVLRKQPNHVEALEIIKGMERKERAKMAQEVYGEVMALVRLGLFGEAEEKIKQCLELDPENKTFAAVHSNILREMEKARAPQPALPAAETGPAVKTSPALNPPVQGAAEEPQKPVFSVEIPPQPENRRKFAETERKVVKVIIPEPSRTPREAAAPRREMNAPQSEPGGELTPDQKAGYLQALQFMQQRNLEEAIRALRTVMEQNRKFTEAPLRLSECLKGRGVKHFAKGNYEQSYRDFQEALRLNPRDPALKKFVDNVEQLLENLNPEGFKPSK